LLSPSIRAKFEKVIREAQDSICAAISEIDGTPFHQDAWTREDGGGGITRVLNVSSRCAVLCCAGT
jgi:coproporphyrinogen III oxidase